MVLTAAWTPDDVLPRTPCHNCPGKSDKRFERKLQEVLSVYRHMRQFPHCRHALSSAQSASSRTRMLNISIFSFQKVRSQGMSNLYIGGAEGSSFEAVFLLLTSSIVEASYLRLRNSAYLTLGQSLSPVIGTFNTSVLATTYGRGKISLLC